MPCSIVYYLHLHTHLSCPTEEEREAKQACIFIQQPIQKSPNSLKCPQISWSRDSNQNVKKEKAPKYNQIIILAFTPSNKNKEKLPKGNKRNITIHHPWSKKHKVNLRGTWQEIEHQSCIDMENCNSPEVKVYHRGNISLRVKIEYQTYWQACKTIWYECNSVNYLSIKFLLFYFPNQKIQKYKTLK